MAGTKVPTGWSEEGYREILLAETGEELAGAVLREIERHRVPVCFICGKSSNNQFIVDTSATVNGPIFNGTVLNECVRGIGALSPLETEKGLAAFLASALVQSGLIERIRLDDSGPRTPLEAWLHILAPYHAIKVYPLEDSSGCFC